MKRPFLSGFFSSSSSCSSRGEADSPDNSGAVKNDPRESADNDEQAFLVRVVQQTYFNLQMFARDVNLPENLAEKYKTGLIIREPAMVDTSRRIGGMSTTHRFAILSNHMKSLEDFDSGNFGLFVANTGSYFKVMGTHRYKGKTFILLLHLPDDDAWKVFRHIQVNLEETMKAESIERLEERCSEQVIPELDNEEWLARCAHPLGMDAQGEFFPLEQPA
jgi:hypothetical protein